MAAFQGLPDEPGHSILGKSPSQTSHGAAHGLPGAVYYLHLDASGLMVACGNYMMQPGELEHYRQAVADDASGEELSGISPRYGGAAAMRLSSGWTGHLKLCHVVTPEIIFKRTVLRQKGLIAMRHTLPGSELQNGPRLRSFVVETFQMCADLTDWLKRYVGAAA